MLSSFLWSLVFDITWGWQLRLLPVVNCFQVFMIFGLWHHKRYFPLYKLRCELLSSFYDLWSLTSEILNEAAEPKLWIAFKFLWSLVFDIRVLAIYVIGSVVNCFQVFMIFGLWHLSKTSPCVLSSCELLSSFYDLWSLTSLFSGICFCLMLWIAFKFLWSLVFDIRLDKFRDTYKLWIAFKFLWSLVFDIVDITINNWRYVVNCFQVFMIFGLWHLNSTKATTAKDYRMSLA